MITEMKDTILHIDDDEANRYAVRRILERAGYNVEEAATGLEGLEHLKKSEVDMVILDINLPDINGYEVCRRIKEAPKLKAVPVLQTSASFVSAENKVTGLESGADGYLAQPIESSVLVATVKSLLRIRIAEKQAYEAVRSREEVLAIVSHDLRNPLTFILLQAKIMEKGFEDGKLTLDDAVNRMKKVKNSCLKMNRLIQDMLDLTKLDQGKFVLQKSPFSLRELLHEVFLYFEEVALQSEISLILEMNDLEETTITADRERLQQVFSNLISNSLKFTSSGGAIRVSLFQENKNIIISVEDTGTGIPKKHLAHVFNRYWQGHPERKSGYGIGLSIVKGIAEAHNGHVEITSEEGVGTKVELTLPILS